jgi:hypothetical protein
MITELTAPGGVILSECTWGHGIPTGPPFSHSTSAEAVFPLARCTVGIGPEKTPPI